MVISMVISCDFYGDFYANWKALSFIPLGFDSSVFYEQRFAHPVVEGSAWGRWTEAKWFFWCNESDEISGKHTKNYGKSPFLMGKSTISMAIFNSYVSLPEGIYLVVVEPYPSENDRVHQLG